jgi:hypothetical protein
MKASKQAAACDICATQTKHCDMICLCMIAVMLCLADVIVSEDYGLCCAAVRAAGMHGVTWRCWGSRVSSLGWR